MKRNIKICKGGSHCSMLGNNNFRYADDDDEYFCKSRCLREDFKSSKEYANFIREFHKGKFNERCIPPDCERKMEHIILEQDENK